MRRIGHVAAVLVKRLERLVVGGELSFLLVLVVLAVVEIFHRAWVGLWHRELKMLSFGWRQGRLRQSCRFGVLLCRSGSGWQPTRLRRLLVPPST